jgi:hypothetical protein
MIRKSLFSLSAVAVCLFSCGKNLEKPGEGGNGGVETTTDPLNPGFITLESFKSKDYTQYDDGEFQVNRNDSLRVPSSFGIVTGHSGFGLAEIKISERVECKYFSDNSPIYYFLECVDENGTTLNQDYDVNVGDKVNFRIIEGFESSEIASAKANFDLGEETISSTASFKRGEFDVNKGIYYVPQRADVTIPMHVKVKEGESRDGEVVLSLGVLGGFSDRYCTYKGANLSTENHQYTLQGCFLSANHQDIGLIAGEKIAVQADRTIELEVKSGSDDIDTLVQIELDIEWF